MKTILVDDNALMLQLLSDLCSEEERLEIVGTFTRVEDVLAYAASPGSPIELAVLDIEMPGMSGLDLCDRLRSLHPGVVIIFVTAHEQYAAQALKHKADFVLFKPVGVRQIAEMADRAQLLARRMQKRVRCQCFGNFTLFVDDVPVYFKNAKAQELLAVCVYRRGALVSVEEIIDKLWEDYTGAPRNCSKYRMAVKSLQDMLREHGIEYIFGRKPGVCYVNRDEIDCDYYRFLEGDPQAIKAFCGEFMENYRWAEGVGYQLQKKK